MSPYWEGWNAYEIGLPRSRNPYHPASEEYQSWNNGWDSAESYRNFQR